MENKEKKFIDGAGKEITFAENDFKLVQSDVKIHDTKFNTEATTFFKDALRRFVKSKSAVAGGSIVGLLVLLAIIVPFTHKNVGVYDVRKNGGGKIEESSLSPKLFNGGFGFWDGTVKKTHVIFNEETQLPVGDDYREDTVYKVKTSIAYENQAYEYGRGGYVNVYCKSPSLPGDMYALEETTFDPENQYTLDFKAINENYDYYRFYGYKVALVNDLSTYYLVGSEDNYETELSKSVNINEALAKYSFTQPLSGTITVYCAPSPKADEVGNVLVESIKFTSSNEDEAEAMDYVSFACGNDAFGKGINENKHWNSKALGLMAYKVEYTYCEFKFDKYEAVYGKLDQTIGAREIKVLAAQNQIEIKMDQSKTYGPTSDPDELADRYDFPRNSSIAEIVEQTGTAKYNASSKSWSGMTLKIKHWKYKDMGYSRMPRYIFGTSPAAKDYCKLIFQGMRLSFLIAIGVSAVNIMIGLVWGSISGYFGGWVDILMERICEIIGGLPTTVLITLCILYGNQWNWGSYADILALMMALFLTGWMGVAGTTRTQFYRYKGREYVLASRTLGAKDKRLIFKHILPNAAGTIITSSILMIPSVIYTESSIAYLKLGLQNQVLLGVILAEANNNYKGELAYTLYIPVFVMTLLLVSFNLFGNGLRDAFNPTLKGGE